MLSPVRAPQANALAERVIGTIRRECLDHLIVLNEADLRRVLREHVPYYNDARPDRSLDLEQRIGPRAVAHPRCERRLPERRCSVAHNASTPGPPDSGRVFVRHSSLEHG